MNAIGINQVVRTNYGTGPYRITRIDGPCTCADYVAHIDGNDTPSEPHFHLTCVWAGAPRRGRDERGNYWLNGYRADGTSVWSDDRLLFDGTATGYSGDLFQAATAPAC